MAILQEEQQAGVPDWVVTFGDMMSLLLTFFILLFSMSEVKQEESAALIDAMRNQFGIGDAALPLMPSRALPINSAIARLASRGRAERIGAINAGDKVKAPEGDRRRVRAIRPGDDSLQGGVVDFPESSGELTAEAIKAIEAAAAVVKGKPQKIEVRGHTSNKPLEPDSPYRNQWDLAYARAFKVKQELIRLGVKETGFAWPSRPKTSPATSALQSSGGARMLGWRFLCSPSSPRTSKARPRNGASDIPPAGGRP